mgnify:CR=1 FL=1
MITKQEYLEWRESEATKKVLELIEIGQEQILDELISARGEIADFQRGADFAFREVKEIIKVGYGIYGEEETK